MNPNYLQRPDLGLTQFGLTVVPLMTTFILGSASQLPHRATIVMSDFQAIFVPLAYRSSFKQLFTSTGTCHFKSHQNVTR